MPTDSVPDSLPVAGLYAKAPPITADDTPIDVSDTAGANIVAKAITYIPANSGTYTLLLGEDVDCVLTANPFATFNKTGVTLYLEGLGANKNISLKKGSAETGTLFVINSGTLILSKNITLRGLSDNGPSLVTIMGGSGKLQMEEGSSITGNRSSGGGGGVTVGAGTFTMTGGTITGNNNSTDSTSGSAGGVSVSGGTFTMTGGIITNNTATNANSGGGVCVNGGIFTMDAPKTQISGNTSPATEPQVYKRSGTINGIVGTSYNNGW